MDPIQDIKGPVMLCLVKYQQYPPAALKAAHGRQLFRASRVTSKRNVADWHSGDGKLNIVPLLHPCRIAHLLYSRL
ncbi:hypothetical protein FKM82_014096 [Ascaphus truei]